MVIFKLWSGGTLFSTNGNFLLEKYNFFFSSHEILDVTYYAFFFLLWQLCLSFLNRSGGTREVESSRTKFRGRLLITRHSSNIDVHWCCSLLCLHTTDETIWTIHDIYGVQLSSSDGFLSFWDDDDTNVILVCKFTFIYSAGPLERVLYILPRV